VLNVATDVPQEFLAAVGTAAPETDKSIPQNKLSTSVAVVADVHVA
jgi:hypothetical protein